MISIIMPAYNAERYIKDAICSVLKQTFTQWELIIIDDCSVDKTSEIIQPYINQYSNIYYYKNPHNLGVAESRNLGVSKASGEWIAYLDSDDCWNPNKLQEQFNLAASQNVDFLFTGSSFIDENSQPLDYFLSVPASVNYQELLKQNIISCSSVMIRKALVQEYPMRNASQLHEDYAVWLQVLRDKNIRAYGINKPLLIYRISSASKSGNKIKAGIMTFRVYRYLGIHLIPAFYYWFCYFVRSLKKYKHLI